LVIVVSYLSLLNSSTLISFICLFLLQFCSYIDRYFLVLLFYACLWTKIKRFEFEVCFAFLWLIFYFFFFFVCVLCVWFVFLIFFWLCLEMSNKLYMFKNVFLLECIYYVCIFLFVEYVNLEFFYMLINEHACYLLYVRFF
jgi:hypothetical protein